MAEKRGILGGLFGEDCSVLFFIIVFLFLFYGKGGFGYKRNPVDAQLDVE